MNTPNDAHSIRADNAPHTFSLASCFSRVSRERGEENCLNSFPTTSRPRSFPLLLSCLAALALTACSHRPIASGKIVLVTMGNKPVMRAGEIGSWEGRTFLNGRVEIFPTYIIVIEPDGTKHSAPLDWFSTVRFK